MKEKIHTKSSFRTTDPKQLQKIITAKMEKLVNIRVKKETVCST